MYCINGTLTLRSISGLIFSYNDGENDPSMSFTGSVASINSALRTMTYTGDPFWDDIIAFEIGNSTANLAVQVQHIDNALYSKQTIDRRYIGGRSPSTSFFEST